MGKRWLPLEANPDVMNQFMWGLGVPENVEFCDVYGLDDDMLAMVPQTVLAVLLLYPRIGTRKSQASTASSVETKVRLNCMVYSAKDGAIEHYVCFSCVDGELYELDGGKSQPIYHGPS